MPAGELILLFAYLLVGPAAWALLMALTWTGRKHMLRLRRPREALPNDPPAVTVLVPAKDEGPRVSECLHSVLAQDYPRFDAIAVNDRSRDDTGQAMEAVAGGAAGRLRVIHVSDLPEGWLGKCHALHLGAREANGRWLLFVDSDVTLSPDALSAALALCIAREYDALSLLTRLQCDTFLERLILPPAAATWATMNGVSLTNNDHLPTRAYANGQFLLVRRDAYEGIGGHAAVKDRITEDVELFRALKKAGRAVRLFVGTDFATTRMHATFAEMLRGWARIYSGTTRRNPLRILVAMGFVGISGASLVAVAAWSLATSAPLARWWCLAMAGHGLLIVLHLANIYRWSGNPRRYAVLFPVSWLLLLRLMAGGLRSCMTGRIEWRGTTFDQRPGKSSGAAQS